jgi:hypothetical protein
MNKLCLLTTAALMLGTMPAMGQEFDPAPTEGTWELALGGSGSSDEDFDNDTFNLNVDVGYYLSPAVAVGVRQTIGFADIGDSSWNGSTTGFIDYHFDVGQFRPFIGLNLGYLYGDDTAESFIAGPEVGAKYYVQDDAFIFGRVEYQFLFEDVDDADDRFDDGRFVYTVGIGLNF